jgi:hypothetical protein
MASFTAVMPVLKVIQQVKAVAIRAVSVTARLTLRGLGNVCPLKHTSIELTALGQQLLEDAPSLNWSPGLCLPVVSCRRNHQNLTPAFQSLRGQLELLEANMVAEGNRIALQSVQL